MDLKIFFELKGSTVQNQTVDINGFISALQVDDCYFIVLSRAKALDNIQFVNFKNLTKLNYEMLNSIVSKLGLKITHKCIFLDKLYGVILTNENDTFYIAVDIDPALTLTAKLEPTKLSTAKLEPTKLSTAKLEPTKLSTAKLEPTAKLYQMNSTGQYNDKLLNNNIPITNFTIDINLEKEPLFSTFEKALLYKKVLFEKINLMTRSKRELVLKEDTEYFTKDWNTIFNDLQESNSSNNKYVILHPIDYTIEDKIKSLNEFSKRLIFQNTDINITIENINNFKLSCHKNIYNLKIRDYDELHIRVSKFNYEPPQLYLYNNFVYLIQMCKSKDIATHNLSVWIKYKVNCGFNGNCFFKIELNDIEEIIYPTLELFVNSKSDTGIFIHENLYFTGFKNL